MCKDPRNANCPNVLSKLLAAGVCLALLLSTTPLVTANNGESKSWNWLGLFSQGQRNGPRQEAPEGVFPNLDEMRLMTDDRRRYGFEAPTIPAAIPSTRRRWRRGSQAAQPSSDVEVNLNALIAFASPASETGVPWLKTQESESLSNLPIGLSSSSVTAGMAASPALLPQSPSNFAMARLVPHNRT